VLPDAASGHDPDTLATKLSRCKEGMARVFAVRVQILLSITCVAPAPLLQIKSGGTRLISGREAVSVAGYWKIGTGAVSRRNLSRSQEFVLIQNFDYVQMSVSGFSSHFEFILLAGA